MYRIPNTSPSGLITNFETKCKTYFHPNVLLYVLRNRITNLSSNFQLLSQNQQHQNSSLFKELDSISFSLISCINNLKSKHICTILFSFSKLGYNKSEIVKVLLDNIDFSNLDFKSVTLLLYFLSKSIEHKIISKYDRVKLLNKIQNFICFYTGEVNKKDIIISLRSIVNLKKSGYNFYQLDDIYQAIIGRLNSDVVLDDIHELNVILESFYLMKYYHKHNVIMEKVKEFANTNLIQLEDLFNLLATIHNYTNIRLGHKISNRVPRDVLNVSREICKFILEYIEQNINLLNLEELAKLASMINVFKIYTSDSFITNYTQKLLKVLKKGFQREDVTDIIKYYNRRYETSINREYFLQYLLNQCKRSDKGELKVKLGRVSNVSNLCGYAHQVLTSKTGDLDEGIRVRRNINFLKSNYKNIVDEPS